LFSDGVSGAVDDIVAHLELLGEGESLGFFNLELHLLLIALVLVVQVLLRQNVLT